MEDAAGEEMMALESIFYDSFTKLGDDRFRVRIDPSDDSSTPPLFVEVMLPRLYPNEIPKFDISNINNSSYPDFVKKGILAGLDEQAASLVGESMCYTVLEWLKDKLPELHCLKPSSFDENDGKDMSTGKKDSKERMTKAQKRRYFDKFGASAEKPRGWDWVSIISHLSQVPQHGSTS